MPKAASSKSAGTRSSVRGREVHSPLGLQERLAPNGENAGVRAIAADARAARRLKREVERDGLVETEDAGTYWAALQTETATTRQLKEANEKLEKKLTKMKGTVSKLQLTLDQSLIKMRANEETLEAKEAELIGVRDLLAVTEARAEQLGREKLRYWEELSNALRTVDVLSTALDGGIDETAGYSQANRLCEAII